MSLIKFFHFYFLMGAFTLPLKKQTKTNHEQKKLIVMIAFFQIKI